MYRENFHIGDFFYIDYLLSENNCFFFCINFAIDVIGNCFSDHVTCFERGMGGSSGLIARVVMNRLWKQFFGTGLSKVLDDLGAQGEPPPNQAG